MDFHCLEAALAGLPVGAIRYYDRLGSTNTEAALWIKAGAPDLSMVVADEQTEGRGRTGQAWYTPAGSALAFSLILYPADTAGREIPRLTALGALAVKDALSKHYGLPAEIKWPNDVLVQRRKVAGVLAEAHWVGSRLMGVVLGIGINVATASMGEIRRHASELAFPATTVETALGHPVERLELLRVILEELFHWRSRLTSQDFLQAWEASLAYHGEWVQVSPGESTGVNSFPEGLERQPPSIQEGQILGLAPDGSLKLRARSGEVVTACFGEVRLRPPPYTAGKP